MRLHVLPDEKIVNRTIDIFEHVFPGENKYVIISITGKRRYVQEDTENVMLTTYDTEKFWQYVGDVSEYQSIIIHLMTKYSVSFINKINHDNIYWIEWGVDLFENLLEPRGFKMYFSEDIMYPFVYPSFKRRFAHKYLKFLFPDNNRKHAIKKVKYFVPDSMYDEYPLLLQYYPQYKHLEYREFFYYPINQVVDETIKGELCHGNNIIVGHSGSFTGNHIEVIDLLSQIELGNRQIKFPLSYGGSQNYRSYIVKYGKDKLKDKFTAVTDYMPLEEYNKFLLDASFYIYNNYRQEAVGNILVALYFGGKVFLSDKSPLFSFYKRLGLVIYGVSELSRKSLSLPIDGESVLNNRRIIEKHYSLDRLYQLVKQNFR